MQCWTVSKLTDSNDCLIRLIVFTLFSFTIALVFCCLNFLFTTLKTNSIGMYSGEYAALNRASNPRSFMCWSVFFARWTLRLSMKITAFLFPSFFRSSSMKNLNLSIFTERSKHPCSRTPCSYVIAAITAVVLILMLLISTAMFWYLLLNSRVFTDLRVNITSSR